MQTVINKIFPEWSNFSEANKNFLQTEDQFVKSLELIQSFEGNNQNMYQIRTLSFLNQKVHEISSILDDGNQANKTMPSSPSSAKRYQPSNQRTRSRRNEENEEPDCFQ